MPKGRAVARRKPSKVKARSREAAVRERPSRALVAQRRRNKAASAETPGSASGTALAAEALQTGIVRSRAKCCRTTLPREDETIRVGDPDDDSMSNEYVGDETPGGSATTPDQNVVDEIGRAYGLQEEDAGDLHSAGEILDRRDHRRAELRPPKKRRY
jgi:hypothetical protein